MMTGFWHYWSAIRISIAFHCRDSSPAYQSVRHRPAASGRGRPDAAIGNGHSYAAAPAWAGSRSPSPTMKIAWATFSICISQNRWCNQSCWPKSNISFRRYFSKWRRISLATSVFHYRRGEALPRLHHCLSFNRPVSPNSAISLIHERIDICLHVDGPRRQAARSIFAISKNQLYDQN